MSGAAVVGSGRLVAAADGSALGNPGPAGWAWYVDDGCWGAGGWDHGTNNAAELTALLELLRASVDDPRPLTVLCDSTYVIKAVTEWMPGWKRRGWRKADGKPVLNQDLLRALDAALQGRDLTLEWVRGHAGHELNEGADVRARAAAGAYQRGEDPDRGPGLLAAGEAPGAVPTTVPPTATQAPTTPVTATPATGTRHATEAPVTLFEVADPTDEEIVVACERELLDPRVRADAERVEQLLHPHFREVGASGRIFGRDQMVQAMMAEIVPPRSLEVLEVSRLDAATMLLLWRCTGGDAPTLRSSLWSLGPSGWQQRHHQGTPEA